MVKCKICSKKVKFIEQQISCTYCNVNNIGSYCINHNHKEEHGCPELDIREKVILIKLEPEKIQKI